MLHELQIDNFAVVDRLKVHFRAGLNLLTGETGSGKSIVVGALSLLTGGRGAADVVREGAEQARISGVFEPQPTAALIELLDQAGFELEDGELIVERQVAASGKSRCYVNGRPATQTLLRELAVHLCDIHGQFDQQKLFSASEQMALLDQFAGLDEAVRSVGAFYAVWRELREKLDGLRGDEQERLRQLDLFRYQTKKTVYAPTVRSSRTSPVCEKTPQPPTTPSMSRPNQRPRNSRPPSRPSSPSLPSTKPLPRSPRRWPRPGRRSKMPVSNCRAI
jgi:DNA repair protein RecN (Recombination protein N)